jgi:hypothetical protein
MTAVGKDRHRAWTEAAARRRALMQRLAAPGRHTPGPVPLPAAPAARLEALLTEIDETVLPRVLVVEAGGRDLARLIVSHRRLISIDLPGRPAPACDADSLAGILAARLVEVAGAAGLLALSIARRSATPGHAEIACSPAALRAALHQRLRESPLDRLIRLAGSHVLASLTWSEASGPGQFVGPPAWDQRLLQMAAPFRQRRAALRREARIGRAAAEGLLLPLGADLVLLFADLDGQGVAAVLPRPVGLALVAAWQQG